MSLYGNNVCNSKDCGYTTNLTSPTEQEADRKLLIDGGFNTKEKTLCPKCKKDSIQYLPNKYFNGYKDDMSKYFNVK
ncbi:hypothetical protein [Lysinibacillus zambalensis]|uniref:hypothetical protein n=1 Tax=Lysinibacillus zambalensis TaxID=3160866 RepID=UPI0032E41CFE